MQNTTQYPMQQGYMMPSQLPATTNPKPDTMQHTGYMTQMPMNPTLGMDTKQTTNYQPMPMMPQSGLQQTQSYTNRTKFSLNSY